MGGGDGEENEGVGDRERGGRGDGETDRQTDRQTDRDKKRQRETERDREKRLKQTEDHQIFSLHL